MSAPFHTATLLCDADGCESDVVGVADVWHPHDEAAEESARRRAAKDAVDKAMAAGWSVATAHEKRRGDLCPKHRGGR